jgi:predicted enzyme involved in methoxymalonyl-ACP biosynthesis
LKIEDGKINSRPMFTCVNEKTPVSSHKKLVEQFHQYLDNLNIELQLQSDDENGTMKKIRDFTSHLNQDLIQRYMPQFQSAFENIV